MCNSIMKTKTLRESISSSTPSSSSSIRAPASKKRARVSFNTIEMREYPMILDDTRVQVPYLTIGWESFNTSVSTVQEYEILNKRDEKAKPLPPKERLVVLLRAGYTAQSLREHLTKPKPEEELEEKPKKQRKTLFSRMKLFKRRMVQTNIARAA